MIINEKGTTVQTTTSSLRSRWTNVRDEYRRRQARSADRRNLQRQLATYSTEAELSELEAVFGRYEGSDVAALRTVIQRARIAA